MDASRTAKAPAGDVPDATQPAARTPSPSSGRSSGKSHIDALVDLVRRTPIPAPLVYGLIAIAFVAIEVAVKMIDGTFPAGFRLIHVLLPIYAMLVVPSAHLFNAIATDAILAARSILTLSDAEVEAYRQRITTIPLRDALIAVLAGLVLLALLTVVQPPDTFAVLGTMTSPLASAVETVWQVLIWSGVGTTAYLMVRQMVIVWALTTRHTRIDLFALGPIYAFSRLTAAHAVFTAAVVAVASLALSRLAGTIQWTIVGGAALLIAAAAFVVPLWGAYRLIATAKRAYEDRLGRTIERLVSQVDDRANTADLAGIESLTSALEGVALARQQVRAISAWPWRPETLGGVVSALLAPFAIWLITRILEAFVLT